VLSRGERVRNRVRAFDAHDTHPMRIHFKLSLQRGLAAMCVA
jgi:hypothetical protein